MAFDLDDEELKATRRMNGSDKDVGSMEQDIKILENYLDKNDNKLVSIKRLEFLEAIEHLIKAYKELEEFKKQVTEIENTNFIKYKNYIPVSLVEEKLKELDRKIKYEDNEKVIIWLHKQRKILQELLEKRK